MRSGHLLRSENYDKHVHTMTSELLLECDSYRHTVEYIQEKQAFNDDINEDTKTILAQGGALHEYTVLIPVAAHQESSVIYHTLQQLALQQTEIPFSVILNMNQPYESDEEAVSQTHKELARAKQDFQHLDIRQINKTYLDPKIGAIRADLWDASLNAGIAGGTISKQQDMIGINGDIDLIKMPRHYIDTIQKTISRKQERTKRIAQTIGFPVSQAVVVDPRWAPIKNASLQTHPNVARATVWSDGLFRMTDVGFEAGAVIPMSWYAKYGGFNAEDKMSEVLNLIAKAPNTKVRMIKGLPLETSPRRYIERLHEHRIDQIWGADTFHADEDYRNAINLPGDISQERLYDLISANASEDLAYAAVATASIKMQKKRAQDSKLDDIIWRMNTGEANNLDTQYFDNARMKAVTAALSNGAFILGRIVQHPDASLILDEASELALNVQLD